MRNINVIENFIDGNNDKRRTQNLYRIGNNLVNYNTTIAHKDGNTIYLNTRKYSVTTSKIQNMIKRESWLMGYLVVDGVTGEILENNNRRAK